MASPDAENGCWNKFRALPHNIWNKVVEKANKAKKMGKDDPKKIIHSLKVGLAITLVSLFFYFKPTYDGFGVSAMWAVLTVIVVFEYSVGATLGRGLNRMLATLVGSALGFGAHWLATHSGKTGEPILIAIFVFIFAGIVTFIRFLPEMKARYDYGLLILMLTFCLISVSGYRDDEVIHMAHKRVTTIIIGSITSVVICILICPVWIGEDLHKLVAGNLEKLGNFLEGFGSECFRTSEGGQANNANKSFLQGYKSILSSKSSEETMANLARWEPCHGRFRFRHPWKQYLKIGTLARICAYKVEALNCHLHSETQTPMEMRIKIQDMCTKISSESGKALKELATTVKTMTKSSLVETHIANSKQAAEALKSLLKTGLWEDALILEIIPAATVASLLIDIITCTEKIAESVQELALLAHFKSPNTHQPQHLLHRGTIQPVSDGSNHVVVIDMQGSE
ncbi:aluminum-activated malate transporter 2 isoform X2 [Manihot esculenta]|uniref:Aluminum-activated malate transporter n=1 Tax=Manihot esculenta TaxID=3983 RepID=A0A2C9W270_MANES|nr:aluminum-activated malate transporter 2 isoform X2 [Manihot esculenta]OAY52125.1 hypothetical protein MANES_04G059800v8 [Manihot esculenta]